MSQTKKRRRLIKQAGVIDPEFMSLYYDDQIGIPPPATISNDPSPILTLGSQQAKHSKQRKALANTTQHALIDRLNRTDNNSIQSEINTQQDTSSTLLDLQSFQLMPLALEIKLSERDLLSRQRTPSTETQQPSLSPVFSDRKADTNDQIDSVPPFPRAIPAAPPTTVDPNDASFYELSTNHSQDDMPTSEDESDLIPPSPTIVSMDEVITTPPHDIPCELNATPTTIIDETPVEPDQGQTAIAASPVDTVSSNGASFSAIIDERRPTPPFVAQPSPPPLETVQIRPSIRIQAMFPKRQARKSKLPKPVWKAIDPSAPTDLLPSSRKRPRKTVKLSKREASRLPKPSTMPKKSPSWTETTLYPSWTSHSPPL